MATKNLKSIQPDEITLFDSVMLMVQQMDPHIRQEIVRILLILLACADNQRLDMDRVAMIANQISGGKLRFDV